MFKTIGLIIVLAVGAIFLSRHRSRAASESSDPPPSGSAEKIASLINDFHQWNAWSPWAYLDPIMKTTYSGPSSGVGSVYEWEGNSKVGKGRMENLAIEPTKTTIELDFLKPFESRNMPDFVLEPQGAATRVNWIMNGPIKFFSRQSDERLHHEMDKVIGPDFDRGLANLKSAATLEVSAPALCPLHLSTEVLTSRPWK